MPEIILLDTHIWLWLVHGKTHLFPVQWKEIFELTPRLAVSPVSCYEIALAVKKGRITLSKTVPEWFISALEPAGIELLPINEITANLAVELSPIHKDPFDRLIIATALVYNAKLASVDNQFPRYPELSTVLLPRI